VLLLADVGRFIRAEERVKHTKSLKRKIRMAEQELAELKKGDLEGKLAQLEAKRNEAEERLKQADSVLVEAASKVSVAALRLTHNNRYLPQLKSLDNAGMLRLQKINLDTWHAVQWLRGKENQHKNVRDD